MPANATQTQQRSARSTQGQIKTGTLIPAPKRRYFPYAQIWKGKPYNNKKLRKLTLSDCMPEGTIDNPPQINTAEKPIYKFNNKDLRNFNPHQTIDEKLVLEYPGYTFKQWHPTMAGKTLDDLIK